MPGNKTRTELVDRFQQGAKPSGADFYDFISSVLNINDDGIERPAGADQPLKISAKGTSENLLDFQMNKQLTWRINQKPDGATNPGLNFQTPDGESKLFIDNASGNVGIGTLTPGYGLGPNYGPAEHSLEVQGDTFLKRYVYIDVDGGIYFKAKNRQMLNLWTEQLGIGVQGGTQYFRTSGNFAWYKGGIHNDGELKSGKGGKALMVITGDNVGIGTTTPAHKLDVSGDARFTGNLTVEGLINGPFNFGNQEGQLLNLFNSQYGIGIQSGTQYFRTDKNFAWYRGGFHAGGELVPGEGGIPLMVIKGDCVGIGTTAPAHKLDVNGTAYFKGDLTADGKINFRSQAGQMLNLYYETCGIGIQGNTQYFRTNANFAWYRGGVHHNGVLKPGTGGKALMVITNDNVGIGTMTPRGKLDVSGDAYVKGKINFDINTLQNINLCGEGYGIGIQNRTQYFRTGASFAWFRGGSPLNVEVNPGPGGVALMVIKDDNVGIGTVAPKHKLDVNGDAHIKGDLHIDGSVYFGAVNRQMINLWTKQLGIGIQGATQYFRTSGNFAWYKGGVHADGELQPGTGGKTLLEVKFAPKATGLAFDQTTIDAPGNRMHIDGGERLYLLNKDGVFITNSWHTTGGNLTVTGNITCGTLTQSSSRKLKENISSFSVKDALKIFKQLNPVKFNLKKDEEKQLHLGFIAEDTPDPVATEKKDAVNFNHIVTLLTKVVQDQQSKISELQDKMNAINLKVAN